MGMVPPRIVHPYRVPSEDELQAFNTFTRTIPGEQPLTWNQALLENMTRPYTPKPEYEEMLFAPPDWQKREEGGWE